MPSIDKYNPYTDLDDDSILLGVDENERTVNVPMSAIKALINDPDPESVYNKIQFIIQDSDVGVGEIGWNDTAGTLDIGLKGGNVKLQVGQEDVLPMNNDTGADIADGKIVKYDGAIGNSGRAKCSLFLAEPAESELYVIGVATEDIADGADGFITTRGLVRNVELDKHGETWVAGQVLYASPDYEGDFTNVEPTAPDLQIPVCILMSMAGVNSTIFININRGAHVSDLHDVHIDSIADGDIIQYNSTTERYENRQPDPKVINPTPSNGDSLVYSTVDSAYVGISGGYKSVTLSENSGLNLTLTARQAKSGNIVHLDIYVIAFDSGGAISELEISGLEYPVSSNSSGMIGYRYGFTSTVSPKVVYALTSEPNVIRVEDYDANFNNTDLTNIPFGAAFAISITYTTN